MQRFVDIGYQIRRSYKTRDATSEELKKKFENIVKNLSDPKIFTKEALKK